ncbi:DUF3800 domain-containing protein [Tunturibacter empetritectus]|uniref:DUF3800 domain-containing protein n=1 Tax=Tunturiibacter lichenicola TaxID=2051959 RepID=A0A7W8N2P5_9BACT|nr:DUF3800 domain-containing protein [Edaphobacter lichenicola]MBB5342618.1 hypothetical protein [Edaphobacter lichenicola]
MHLLYADESGSIGDPNQNYFVLAGVSVFERETHWIETELNKIAARFLPHNPHAIELHGSPMRTGRNGWDQFPQVDRHNAIIDALKIGVCDRHPRHVRIFAAVLDKRNFAGQDIAKVAFEQLSSRFDQFLGRLYRQKDDPQRGLILFDESATEARIQTLAREFKHSGHTYGVTRNYAEVPVFMDSRASRLIQLADLVAYAVFLQFERGDDRYYKTIQKCFDSEGGVVHGLYTR